MYATIDLKSSPAVKYIGKFGSYLLGFAFGFALPPAPIALVYCLILRSYFSDQARLVVSRDFMTVATVIDMVIFAVIAWPIAKRSPAVSFGIAIGILFAFGLELSGAHLLVDFKRPFIAEPPNFTIS